jgi:hypothetical protein
MTEHINAENLVLVIEECSEVIKVATKIIRFGVDHANPQHDVPNRTLLMQEVGDLFATIERLQLDPDVVGAAWGDKHERLKIYGPEGSLYDRLDGEQ